MNPAQPKQILVVEDSRTIREMLRETLSQEGYEIIVKENGEDAFQQVTNQPFDLVLSDVILPGIDGYELSKKIRQNPSTKHIPILLQTVKGGVADKIAGFEAGADGYLIKPYAREELVSRIQSFLKREQRQPEVSSPRSKRGKTIAIFAAKGGVGKTTISVNLAVALQALLGKGVALMDADFSFGLVGVSLNISSTRNILDILQNFASLDEGVIQQVMVTHESGLTVLAAPQRPEEAEMIGAEHISKIFEMLPNLFDLIIVDCQAVYDERMLQILERADLILMIISPEIGPLMTTSRFLDLTDRLDLSKENISLILNRCDSKVGLGYQEIEDVLSMKISAKLVSGGRDVTQSNNLGVPIVIGHPKHPFTLGIQSLAKGIGRMIHVS